MYAHWQPLFDRIAAQIKAGAQDLKAAQAERAQVKQFQLEIDWNEENQRMVSNVGTEIDEVTAAIGLSVAAYYKRLGVQVDWTLYDEGAAEWAGQYKYTLIRDLTDSTRSQLGRAISQWIASDDDLEGLIAEVGRIVPTNPYPVLRDRARLIAQTETTRVYSESRMRALSLAGLKQMEWRTANDELVCPLCGPLNEKTGTIQGGVVNPDNGQAYKPPAHPGCRCWLVESVTELETFARA